METAKEIQSSTASTKAPESEPSTFEKDDDGEYDLEDDEEEYPHLFESIRSPTGLEVGLSVTWPGTERIELSTCLPSDEIAPMFHGTQWAGTRVWKAAIVALQYLLDEKGPLKEEFQSIGSSNFSCLELGCGLGVPGMILSRFYPQARVVLTDCNSLVPQLQLNLVKNFADAASNNLTASTLDWAEENDLTRLLQECQLNSFDVVLNCDCIYEPLYGDSWKALLKIQIDLLERKPDTLMLTSLERRKFDGADKYLASLRGNATVAKVDLVHQDDPVEIYRICGLR